VTTTVLAHQAGWDEILSIMVPLGLLGLLIWLAAQRFGWTSIIVTQQPERESNPELDQPVGHPDRQDRPST